MPTFGSLFAGIGGIDLGLERAGWTGRWQVEYEPFCQRVLAKHWPDVPRYGDIRDVDWSTVEPVDLIAGGFPCQPVSFAGRRRIQDDDRWLWPEFARCIRELGPRYVLVENVPGLLVGGGMDDVLGGLADLGYDCEWESIPAAAVGAPHLRYRVWLIAYPHRDSQSGESGDAVTGPRVMVPRRDVAHTDSERQGRTPALGPSSVTGLCAEEACPEPHGSSHGAVAHTNGTGPQGRSVQPERADQWPVGAGSLADATGSGSGSRWSSDDEPRWTDGSSRGGQLDLGDYWLTEPDVGRVAHGVPARVDRLRSLGNAVVPQVVEWIGRRILEAEEVTA